MIFLFLGKIGYLCVWKKNILVMIYSFFLIIKNIKSGIMNICLFSSCFL